MSEEKKNVRVEDGSIKEGSIRKGGLGRKPSSSRPKPPKAQSVSDSGAQENSKSE